MRKVIRTAGNTTVVNGLLEEKHFLTEFQIVHEIANPNGLLINISTCRENKVETISWNLVRNRRLASDRGLVNSGKPKSVTRLTELLVAPEDRILADSLLAELQTYLTEKGAHVDFAQELKLSGEVLVVHK